MHRDMTQRSDRCLDYVLNLLGTKCAAFRSGGDDVAAAATAAAVDEGLGCQYVGGVPVHVPVKLVPNK
jgi:hypothetical protein